MSSVSPVLALFKDSNTKHDRRLRWVAMALLAWGVLVMVVSLSLNICAFERFPPLPPRWDLRTIFRRPPRPAAGARQPAHPRLDRGQDGAAPARARRRLGCASRWRSEAIDTGGLVLVVA